MIVNPPFSIKYQFVTKAFDSDLPFIMLLPLQILSTRRGKYVFAGRDFFFGIVSPTPHFVLVKSGVEKETSVGEVMWLFGNFAGRVPEKTTFYPMHFLANV